MATAWVSRGADDCYSEALGSAGKMSREKNMISRYPGLL